ncbi:hypothetical protein F2Q69_00038586 [Brassica cretica]|uniref:Uncharacterized protein n=1 Tax=Brassica cretica TaxID=69181 RepID=A0A8S9SRL0_BRACR|nr:hypothetical protein F2Q69_00038586 [Brassica cretica]
MIKEKNKVLNFEAIDAENPLRVSDTDQIKDYSPVYGLSLRRVGEKYFGIVSSGLQTGPSQETKLHQAYVISGGLEAGDVSHPAVKKNTKGVGDDPETIKSEHPGIDKIGFTGEEREKVFVPHHDALVISLTIANCLVKRILVDSGSSCNIIFQAAYQGLGLEENALIRKMTALIGFSG